MTTSSWRALLAVTLWLSCAAPAWCAALRIDPVLVDVTAPGTNTTLTLRNEDAAPVDIQIRVFRWAQVEGSDALEATTDVVASPPAVTVPPQSDYTIRLVRVSRRPIAGEESYRLIIDQLPDLTRQKQRSVAVVLRQSLPVFFGVQKRSPAAITWSIFKERNRLVVEAKNDGESRLRIAALKLRDAKGNTVSFGDGLIGYALAGSRMRWSVVTRNHDFGSGGSVSLSASSDDGSIHATLPIGAR